MRFSIFSRLFAGYIAVILIFGGITAYSVYALHQLNGEVNILFNRDERVIEAKDKLVDSLLSQVRSARKFVITGDVALLEQMISGQKDFDKYIEQVSSIVGAGENRDPLARIQSHYAEYTSLVNKEIEFVRIGQPYDKLDYRHKEGQAVERVMQDLKKLETYYRQDIQRRLTGIRQTTGVAQRMSFTLFSAALLLVIIGVFMNTRGITKPLKVLMYKTKEISRGVFKADLDIASPREISELAGALNRMCEKLQEVDSMKSGFFATMSHELRTPLASIKQGITLLREHGAGPVTEKQKRLFTILTEETNRLIEIVNSFLELSKMEAGMMPFTLKEENLPYLVRRVLKEMTPLVEAKKIDMETDIGDEKEVPLLKLDRERILQAVRNLVGNAVKFTPQNGSIAVRVYSAGTTVRFSIKDTGPGVSREDLETIFEKFHQVRGQPPGSLKGTGLGLAFVKQIITAHGGKVWVESEEGKGSTFIFSLPS